MSIRTRVTDGVFWPGDTINLQSPLASTISLPDLATRLSRLPLLAGGTRDFISLAQYSVMLVDRAPREARALATFFHAHRALSGDILLDPYLEALTRLVPDDVFTSLAEARSRLRDSQTEAIFEAAGLSIKDHLSFEPMVANEDFTLMVSFLFHAKTGTALRIVPDSCERARADWLNAVAAVSGKRFE
jgi:hypothetical protein